MSRVHKPAMIRSETAIQDEDLMASEHGFGDDGTKATRFCQSDHGHDQMNEQYEQVAHPGNSINTSKSRRIQANLAISHRSSHRTSRSSFSAESSFSAQLLIRHGHDTTWR